MKLKRASIITKIIVLAVFCYLIMTLLTLQNSIASYQSEQEMLEQQVEQLQRSNDSIRTSLEGQDDPSYWEDIAREKLGLVKPGERVFIDITN